MYVAASKNMGHDKAVWRVVCRRAWQRFPLTPQRKHMRAQTPSVVPPPPLYRLPGQQERDIPGGMLRRRAGGERQQEEENKEEERRGTKDNRVRQL